MILNSRTFVCNANTQSEPGPAVAAVMPTLTRGSATLDLANYLGSYRAALH